MKTATDGVRVGTINQSVKNSAYRGGSQRCSRRCYCRNSCCRRGGGRRATFAGGTVILVFVLVGTTESKRIEASERRTKAEFSGCCERGGGEGEGEESDE